MPKSKTDSVRDNADNMQVTINKRLFRIIPASKFVAEEKFRIKFDATDFSHKNKREDKLIIGTKVIGPSGLTVMLAVSQKGIGGLCVPAPLYDDFIDNIPTQTSMADCVKNCGGTMGCFYACAWDRTEELIEAAADAVKDAWGDLEDWWDNL